MMSSELRGTHLSNVVMTLLLVNPHTAPSAPHLLELFFVPAAQFPPDVLELVLLNLEYSYRFIGHLLQLSEPPPSLSVRVTAHA